LSSPAIPDPDDFAVQKQLVEAALVHGSPAAPPSVATVCAEAGLHEVTFYVHFDAPADLYPAFYDLVVDQYRLLSGATEGYESFSVEERLASFFYILLDALAEQRPFVRETFDTSVRTDSRFRAEVREELRTLLTDERIPDANRLVTGTGPVQVVLTEITIAVLRHWIHDDSPDQAATTALVDKLVAFLAELVVFRGVSRGLDLAWYVAQNDALGLRHLPILGRLLPGREPFD